MARDVLLAALENQVADLRNQLEHEGLRQSDLRAQLAAMAAERDTLKAERNQLWGALENEHSTLVHPEGDDMCRICDLLDASNV